MAAESLDGGTDAPIASDPGSVTSEPAYAGAVLSGIKVAWGLTSASTILDVSDELCKLTGFTREALVGLPMPWPFWPPERIELLMGLVDNVRQHRGSGDVIEFELPMRHRDGTRFTCEVFCDQAWLPDGRELGWVTTFHDVSARRDHEQQLERLATHDALTELANRRLFEQRLSDTIAEAVRRERSLAVALLDIDGFKSVNDRFGHPAGDQALREVARRLRRVLRRGELVARMGGEEFAWIIPEADADGAWAAVERARRAISGEPLPVVGELTISVGVALRDGLSDPDELYIRADQALYRSKTEGGDRSVRWEPGMDASTAERDRLR